MEPITYSTAEVADLLGVSYRQLDHFARAIADTVDPAVFGGAIGSGSRRRWPAELVARLDVACRLAEASGRHWHSVARAVYDAALPTPAGWVVLDRAGAVRFAQTPDELAAQLVDCDGGLVAPYDCLELAPA